MQLKLNTENNYEKLFIVTTEDESNRCNVIQMPYKANNKEKVISNTEKTRTEFYLIKYLLTNTLPQLFKYKTRPLAHDIREQILDKYPEFESKNVLRFLRFIFSTVNYLEVITVNADTVLKSLDHRFDTHRYSIMAFMPNLKAKVVSLGSLFM
jgi:hypothetical protein